MEEPAEQDGRAPGEEGANASPEPRADTVLQRLHRALGPLAGGMILDFADLATLGPIGLVLGPFVGAGVGYWISSLSRFGWKGRVGVALLSAVYVTLPYTGFLPLATLISALARFFREEREA